MVVLLTGAEGFLGVRVHRLLLEAGHSVLPCDVDDDVLSERWVRSVRGHRVDACVHLAAHKYATTAEEAPELVADLNVRGTANVVRACGDGCRVVLASTCKAADPCTVYGASKLIAERVVLNAGGVVLRLVNVLGSTGSVLELWREAPDGPLGVTDCRRMWMDAARAAGLFVRALSLEPGRYAPVVPPASSVWKLAARAFPKRELVSMPLRRGDRPVERLMGEYETSRPAGDGLVRIVDCWEESA